MLEDFQSRSEEESSEGGLYCHHTSSFHPARFIQQGPRIRLWTKTKKGMGTTYVDVKVQRNFKGEFPIVVGFAGTIHKFQGDTMDDDAIAMNFNGSRDLNLVYTALSRVKCMDQIVAIQL
ncbi:uncharacterized protein TNCV_298951 [Trichonephila clavipes]|nr:uncharacterized protein TNCV_298951 [Trichonephila clavipes]